MRTLTRSLLLALVLMVFAPATASADTYLKLLTASPQPNQNIRFEVNIDDCNDPDPTAISWGLMFNQVDPDNWAQLGVYPVPGNGLTRARNQADVGVEEAEKSYLAVGTTTPNLVFYIDVTLPAGTYNPRVIFSCYSDLHLAGKHTEVLTHMPTHFDVGTPPRPGPSSLDPIIFIPGVMGSQLRCGDDTLWIGNLLSLDVSKLRLQQDGATDAAGNCASGPVRATNIIESVGPISVYGPAMEFLREYGAARGRLVIAFSYDWRKSPETNMAALEETVRSAQNLSGRPKVMLVAHSMGGLLGQLYIKDAARAKGVSRLVTIGTPYWGAPKPYLALSMGWLDPDSWLASLDTFIYNPKLQELSRNLPGVFALYPSDNYVGRNGYGPWLSTLSIGSLTFNRGLGQGAVADYAAKLGATKQLVVNARKLHADSIDGFTTNGVDYHAIVSSGIPTVGHIYDSEVWAKYTYEDGDGSVPLLSQTQGAVIGSKPPLGDAVTFSHVCEAEHGEQPGVPKVTSILAKLLEPTANPSGEITNCARPARFEITLDLPFGPTVVIRSKGSVAAQAAAKAKLPKELLAAEKRGDIEILPAGPNRVTIVTRTAKAVTLPVKADAITVRKLTKAANGVLRASAPTQYLPPKGRVTSIRTGAQVTLKTGRTNLKAIRLDRTAPKLTYTVKRVRNMAVITLTGKDASGLSSFVVQRGTKKPQLLTGRVLRVPVSELTQVKLFAVDRFGNSTKAVRPKLPRAVVRR